MRTEIKLAVLLFAIVSLVPRSEGHGYMRVPPGRSSVWREFSGAPINYDDNGLNCGGARGQCGVCGDPPAGPLENEKGGKYATGIISRAYTEGQVIKITVIVTANHKGWFEYSLCPINDGERVTEDCLAKNVLHLNSGEEHYQLAGNIKGPINMEVKLPEGVTCEHCVLRWKWNAGNSWGTDAVTGRGCIGCGFQEQFYSCADVSIAPKMPHARDFTAVPVTAAPETPAPQTPAPETPAPETPAPEKPVPDLTSAPVTSRPVEGDTKPLKPTDQRHCYSIGVWTVKPGMDGWCLINCNMNYCPEDYCKCD